MHHGGIGLLGTKPPEELMDEGLLDADRVGEAGCHRSEVARQVELALAADRPLPGRPGGDRADRQVIALYDQAKNFALAFLRGQPHRATIATTLLKDKINQFRS